MRIASVIVLFCLGCHPGAENGAAGRAGLSARRDSAEPFAKAVSRSLVDYDEKADSPFALQVVNRKAPLSAVDLSRVPRWDAATLARNFAHVRDTRFLRLADQPSFPRRPSFLYPDDGCFARAELMSYETAASGRPAKVYSFGALSVRTDNHPSGQVSWWYHVAALVLVNEQPMVLDPSIEPASALSLREWLSRQGDVAQIQVSVCSSYSYTPGDLCDETVDPHGVALADQGSYLNSEWARQGELGRDPTEVLGDHPPWAQR
jgi:hypothetical protein